MEPNQQCPKCHSGTADVVKYVIASDGHKPPPPDSKPQPLLVCMTLCPDAEHLHLICNSCGYFEAKPVQS
jgi:hypothetical protein